MVGFLERRAPTCESKVNMYAERRSRRSPYRFPATSRYLEALVEREGLSAAVLSDEDGPIAGRSDIGADLDDLAGLGTLGLRGHVAREGGDEVWSQSVRVGDRLLVLTTVGGRVREAQVEQDLGRILARAS
jgi:hypothetical protein